MTARSSISTFFPLLLAATTLSAGASDDKGLPVVTEEGLHLVEHARLAVVYADPEANLSGYGRIHLVDPTVAFRKNWLRDQRSHATGSMRATSKDVERIRQELAEEFKKVFTETLTSGGYELTDEIADDVLLVRPAIINLDISAPDTRSVSRSQTYAKSAGEMTLYVELYDSVTSDLLAKAYDRQGDSDSQIYTWVSPSTNKALADRIIKSWAGVLVTALDEARGKTPPE